MWFILFPFLLTLLCVSVKRGRNVLIVPGGARESIVAHPGTMNLLLRNRKGFVRLALNQGKPLVPVLSFGETDM